MKTEATVNLSEREAFLTSIKKTKYAGIENVQAIYYTMSLQAHRQEFIHNKRGMRDGHRAALFMECIKLKNAEAAVLAFFIALSQAGFKGTVCPEDVLAAQVVQSTGAKCAPRTFRRALAGLCRAGWLVKRSMATGTKVITANGWATLQVNKITIPRCTYMLGSRKGPKAAVVPPRPNRPAIGEAKQVPPLTIGGGPCLVHSNYQLDSKVRNEESQLATAQQATPTPSPTSPPLKHQAIKGDGHTVPESQPKMAVHPFGRKNRSRIANTWQNARSLLLHDLQLGGASAFELRTATTQTDLRYPALLPVALDWEKVVPAWLEMDWKDRARAVRREILPDLSAWCRPLVPPDPKLLEPCQSAEVRAAAAGQLAQFERVSKIMKSLPELLVNDSTPDFVRQMIAEKNWMLSQVSALLAMGRITLDEITQNEFRDFDRLADVTGGIAPF